MKNKLENIRIDLVDAYDSIGRAIDTVDLALQHFDNSPIENFAVEWEGENRFITAWDSIIDGVELDIFFTPKPKDFKDDNSKIDWKHSVNKYFKYHKERVFSELEQHPIGFGKNDSDQVDWLIQAREINGDWKSDIFLLKANTEQSEEPPVKIKHMAWGWWDLFLPDETFADYPHANTLRTYADNVDKALETDAQYVIPTLGFGKRFSDDLTEYKIRQILRHKGRHFKDETRERVPWVIIQDEPKGWTQDQLELVIRLAEEEINSNLLYTYSFSGTHILQERVLPQNAKIIHWNHYPFREATYPSGWGYVDSKEDFMTTFDVVVEKVQRNTSRDVKMALTTQTFAEYYTKDDWDGVWQWAHPHPESPIWYAEAMSKHDFVGGLHYLYKSSKSDVVAIDMPELLDNVKEVWKSISI